MALYDHRVFRCAEEWWIGQVHMGSGTGVGNVPVGMSRETVTFTCMTNRAALSRRNRIVAGQLNRLGHSTICRLLKEAKEWGHRFEMYPYNAPNEEHTSRVVKDGEGLRWGIRWGIPRHRVITVEQAEQAQLKPSVELVCLDDSALRKEVCFSDDVALKSFVMDEGRVLEAIALAKQTYDENGLPDQED